MGADYQFHTRVYRTGSVDRNGTLAGDLVLVASGDPNLSARVRPDGTLAFENEDHAYDGDVHTRAVPGDPLLIIRKLAAQVAEHGIKRISGRVLVDATLFKAGDRELGTDVVMSPIVVNDNLVDLTIGPGARTGAAAVIAPAPVTSYVRIVNDIHTGAPGSAPERSSFAEDTADAGGVAHREGDGHGSGRWSADALCVSRAGSGAFRGDHLYRGAARARRARYADGHAGQLRTSSR